MSTQGKEGWGWALGTQTLPVTLKAEWLGVVCAVDLQALETSQVPTWEGRVCWMDKAPTCC